MSSAPLLLPPGVGGLAPDFELPNQFGEPVHLRALRGRPVVVIFFPFAFSPVCTGELGAVRDNGALFSEAGAEVIAVSADSKYALRAYADAEGFEFPLLADFWPHGEVARRYGVFDDRDGMARRGTFILDAEGVVRYSVVNPRGEARSLDEYRAALAAISRPADDAGRPAAFPGPPGAGVQ